MTYVTKIATKGGWQKEGLLRKMCKINCQRQKIDRNIERLNEQDSPEPNSPTSNNNTQRETKLRGTEFNPKEKLEQQSEED